MPPPTLRPSLRLYPAVLAGIIAGSFDITYAVGFSAWYRSVPPARVFQSVASGLLGAAAFNGGIFTAVLGLLLHYLIAIVVSLVFFALARRFPLLRQRPVVCGAAYGFLVFWIMNLVVLPLSALPRKVSFAPVIVVTGLAVHMFLIGVPIAWIARRAFARNRPEIPAA